MAVAGRDDVGTSGHGCGDDMIVVWIISDDPRCGPWRDEIDQLGIKRDHLPRRYGEEIKPLSWAWTRQHIGQFSNRRLRGKKFHVLALPDRL